jgi:hypothetical protein
VSRAGGSALRLIVGIACIVAALVTTVYGFFNLARVLEGGGYGTSAQRNALLVLGGAGALLAAGIAIIIWDISKRYEHPT